MARMSDSQQVGIHVPRASNPFGQRKNWDILKRPGSAGDEDDKLAVAQLGKTWAIGVSTNNVQGRY